MLTQPVVTTEREPHLSLLRPVVAFSQKHPQNCINRSLYCLIAHSTLQWPFAKIQAEILVLFMVNGVLTVATLGNSGVTIGTIMPWSIASDFQYGT